MAFNMSSKSVFNFLTPNSNDLLVESSFVNKRKGGTCSKEINILYSGSDSESTSTMRKSCPFPIMLKLRNMLVSNQHRKQ